MTALTIKDINTKINGEPRVLDLKLAKALGFKNPLMVRKTIKRHFPALERFATLSTVETVRRGQNTTEYYLTEKQALYLCTKSQAEKAIEITIQMVELFYQVRHGLRERPQLALPHPDTDYWRQEAEQWRKSCYATRDRYEAMLGRIYTRVDVLKTLFERMNVSLPPVMLEVIGEQLTGINAAITKR